MGQQLRAGYSANATVLLSKASQVLTVPESVIEWAGDSTYVYLLTDSIDGQKFERKAVTTGTSDGVNIEVSSGITSESHLRGHIITDMPNSGFKK